MDLGSVTTGPAFITLPGLPVLAKLSPHHAGLV